MKIAKAQAVGAQYQLDNARLQAEAQVQSRFNEVQQLQKTLQTYDVPLMYETLGLLKEAVKAGQLSVIEYYTEADAVYRNLQAYGGREPVSETDSRPLQAPPVRQQYG